jgi:hypothetical protein
MDSCFCCVGFLYMMLPYWWLETLICAWHSLTHSSLRSFFLSLVVCAALVSCPFFNLIPSPTCLSICINQSICIYRYSSMGSSGLLSSAWTCGGWHGRRQCGGCGTSANLGTTGTCRGSSRGGLDGPHDCGHGRTSLPSGQWQ